MPSPNHWTTKLGNSHYLHMLKKTVAFITVKDFHPDGTNSLELVKFQLNKHSWAHNMYQALSYKMISEPQFHL